MANKRNIGQKGENIALEFLENKGYKVIEKNYVKNHGEIDLITSIEDTIVFVEVKLRNSLKFGHPLESMSQKKIAKLVETANLYIVDKGLEEKLVRFDVISILKCNEAYTIDHIENAF